MWLWDDELRGLGFRRKSERYWACERRFGLAEGDHLSVFSWGEQTIPGGNGPARHLVELTEFHVTLARSGENLHFYYHEHNDNEWVPGGHTSGGEIARLGLSPAGLRAEADGIASALASALGGTCRPREKGGP